MGNRLDRNLHGSNIAFRDGCAPQTNIPGKSNFYRWRDLVGLIGARWTSFDRHDADPPSLAKGVQQVHGLKRDRLILWGVIILLALVIVAQVVANRLESHWRNAYRHPSPATVRQLAP